MAPVELGGEHDEETRGTTSAMGSTAAAASRPRASQCAPLIVWFGSEPEARQVPATPVAACCCCFICCCAACLASCWAFLPRFHFMRLFWNQILTCLRIMIKRRRSEIDY